MIKYPQITQITQDSALGSIKGVIDWQALSVAISFSRHPAVSLIPARISVSRQVPRIGNGNCTRAEKVSSSPALLDRRPKSA